MNEFTPAWRAMTTAEKRELSKSIDITVAYLANISNGRYCKTATFKGIMAEPLVQAKLNAIRNMIM